MGAAVIRSRVTEEWSFLILRALAMIGGVIALFLVPHPPEHAAQLRALAWAFILYKAGLFAVIWGWPRGVRLTLQVSIGLDLVFVACFVWLSGGIQSHFYLLFYLLIALAAAHGGPGPGILSAAGGGLLYVLASLPGMPEHAGQHALVRIATFFLLGGSLGYLSRRERSARDEGERLNAELQENQGRLEAAYQALQMAQHRLVQAERLATIGQMSAKVSHEVRNPLSAISLNVELLEDELAGLPPERRAEAAGLLKAMRSQIDVLSAVTEEYLRFARLPKPKLEIVALGALIEDLIAFIRPELEGRGVYITTSLPPDLPSLRLDPGQIRQLLLNLFRNGADAMPDGGSLTIAVGVVTGAMGQPVQTPDAPHRSAPSIEVVVTDSGPGVPAEERERIFEPFFSTKDKGTGLGLAIARQMAEDHGGTLTCERAPAGGSLFRLHLPVAEPGAAR
ncbi:MAG: ATP-binding protein [candidate division NC10 bacterium]|nr:ATP-binding protein [candidate division NC10 bacterium]